MTAQRDHPTDAELLAYELGDQVVEAYEMGNGPETLRRLVAQYPAYRVEMIRQVIGYYAIAEQRTEDDLMISALCPWDDPAPRRVAGWQDIATWAGTSIIAGMVGAALVIGAAMRLGIVR